MRTIAQIVLFVLLACGCDAAFTDLRPPLPDLVSTTADMSNAVPGPDFGQGTDAEQDAAPGVEAVVATGSFVARANYGGEGSATLVRLPDGTHEVRLGADFRVGGVPGPVAVLAREDSLGSTLDAARGDLELGVLEANSGASTYAVPGSPGDRRIVWIYCKPFGLQMTSAALEEP